MKTVFVASSRKFYDIVKAIKAKLDEKEVKGFYPYFDQQHIENDYEAKKQVTLRHFPEIDQADVLYVVCPRGYVGHSVTVEITYAKAKGKEIIASDKISEMAVQALVGRIMTPQEFIDYCSSK